jgi:hypothetical protein
MNLRLVLKLHSKKLTSSLKLNKRRLNHRVSKRIIRRMRWMILSDFTVNNLISTNIFR